MCALKEKLVIFLNQGLVVFQSLDRIFSNMLSDGEKVRNISVCVEENSKNSKSADVTDTNYVVSKELTKRSCSQTYTTGLLTSYMEAIGSTYLENNQRVKAYIFLLFTPYL